PLMMGLEEHLLTMFRDDFEFHDDAPPSHLGPAPSPTVAATQAPAPARSGSDGCSWHADAEKELAKIPFFVRGKARRNTERFARERSVPVITVETLYDAKAHFSR
ncbi:MAG: ferredoxin:protochlorophyllide reductase (ATP-dependent) subunit B, partial [Gammaproteobacteria bacterium]|nr:ferredoxin:protochlorophyllide reductase (ATP-dependent) subunit B [Gammaproteobacteria bacterium]